MDPGNLPLEETELTFEETEAQQGETIARRSLCTGAMGYDVPTLVHRVAHSLYEAT